jgi:hypothetical protein
MTNGMTVRSSGLESVRCKEETAPVGAVSLQMTLYRPPQAPPGQL